MPTVITSWNSLRRPLMIATRCTTCVQPSVAARRLAGSVTSPATSFRAEPAELRRAIRPADERADVAALRAQRVHDLRADEAGRRR